MTCSLAPGPISQKNQPTLSTVQPTVQPLSEFLRVKQQTNQQTLTHVFCHYNCWILTFVRSFSVAPSVLFSVAHLNCNIVCHLCLQPSHLSPIVSAPSLTFLPVVYVLGGFHVMSRLTSWQDRKWFLWSKEIIQQLAFELCFWAMAATAAIMATHSFGWCSPRSGGRGNW